MLKLEKKTKGFTLLELLVVLAIIFFITSLSYPSFSSWIATRNTNDAVTKIESAFRSIATQIQRGVYTFGQIQIQNKKDKIIIVTKGIGQETFNQKRLTPGDIIHSELQRCSLKEEDWDNNSISYYESEYASVNLDPDSSLDTGAICFSKDGNFYSGAGGFITSGSVDAALFICSRKEALKFGKVYCQVVVSDIEELNPVVEPKFTKSKNFYNISWSIFGSIVTEKWSKKEGEVGKWIERQ